MKVADSELYLHLISKNMKAEIYGLAREFFVHFIQSLIYFIFIIIYMM